MKYVEFLGEIRTCGLNELPKSERSPDSCVRLLYIDGCGTKGIVPITVLNELEKNTNKKGIY